MISLGPQLNTQELLQEEKVEEEAGGKQTKSNIISAVTYLFFEKILHMIAQNIPHEELNKVTASNLTFDVNWCVCMQSCHTVCIILQLSCIKSTRFNPEM